LGNTIKGKKEEEEEEEKEEGGYPYCSCRQLAIVHNIKFPASVATRRRAEPIITAMTVGTHRSVRSLRVAHLLEWEFISNLPDLVENSGLDMGYWIGSPRR
jgi:hypothetical protein